MRLLRLAQALHCVFTVVAQTVTTTDSAGHSIVEVITLDPQGNPLTQILQTLTSPTTTALATTSTSTTASTSTTTSTSTTPDIQQGPVASPSSNSGTPGGPTPYQYTTTNAAGQIIVVSDVFTPSFPATILPPVTTTGTVLQYSDWLSLVGGSAPTAASNLKSGTESRHAVRLVAVLCIVGGLWVLL